MYDINIRDKIKSLVGESGKTYIDWYNDNHGTEITIKDDWSSIVVSWCAREVGIPDSVIPDTMDSDTLMAHYKEVGLWKDHDETYAPPAGALIFLKKESDREKQRVGIVDYSIMRDDGMLLIYTYVGVNEHMNTNLPPPYYATTSGGKIITTNYSSKSKNIEGYVVPEYDTIEKDETTEGGGGDSDIVGYEGTEDRDGTVPFPTHIFEEYENLPSLDAQPYYAFVDLYIGGHAFPNIPPQYLVSLSVDSMMLNGSSVITLVLYDKYNDEIEEILYRGSTFQEGGNHAYVRYGHTTGRESKLLPFTVSNYTIDFEGEGSILTITGNIQAAVKGNLEGTGIFAAGTTPSEAVKNICTNVLKVGFTEESIHPAKALVGPDDEIISFNLIREEDCMQYIKTVLCPRAIREKDGVGGYQFYIDDNQIAHFHPLEVSNSALRTYVYQKGVNTNVVSLSVSNEFMASGVGDLHIASDLEAVNLNPITNEETVQKRTIAEVYRNVTGEYTHKKPGQSTQLIETGAMSYGETEADLEYRMSMSYPTTIDMTVVGDPTLTYASYIRLIILTRNNKLHHTSGIYTISNLSMTIQDGIMLSTMHLFRNNSISMEGVEMLKYKSLYK